MKQTKQYLGDGVYVEPDNCGGIVLTTSNGVRSTNTIYLDDMTMSYLIQYYDRCVKLIEKEF